MMNLRLNNSLRISKITPPRNFQRGFAQQTGTATGTSTGSTTTQIPVQKTGEREGEREEQRGAARTESSQLQQQQWRPTGVAKPRRGWRTDLEPGLTGLMDTSMLMPSLATSIFGGLSPFRELNRVARVMENQLANVGREFGDLSPRVDVEEAKDSYVIKAEIPGVPKENIKVDIDNNVLTLRGEKVVQKEEGEGELHRKERIYGSFFRQFVLPEDVDPKGVKANYENGVLKLMMPKKEGAEKKQEVKVD